MEHLKLPFLYWHIAMHLLTGSGKSFSTVELQRQLGHRRYQPIWEMCCKLRDVMGKREDMYSLSGQIEPDHVFITTLISDEQKGEKLKRGCGSQNRSKVVVMTESTFVENPKPGKLQKRLTALK